MARKRVAPRDGAPGNCEGGGRHALVAPVGEVQRSEIRCGLACRGRLTIRQYRSSSVQDEAHSTGVNVGGRKTGRGGELAGCGRGQPRG